MTTTATKPKRTIYSDNLYSDDHRGVEYWFAVWKGHSDLKVTRRLGKTSELTLRQAKREARSAYLAYDAGFEAKLKILDESTPEELEEFAQRASFPRVVVAYFINRICDRIARSEGLTSAELRDEDKGRPGLKLFAERANISAREANRLLEDEDRLSVGHETVDKICVQFDLIFEDFISESFDWARRQGQWANRPGSRDHWPVGYFSTNAPAVNDDGIL